jgi:hypothetical protein
MDSLILIAAVGHIECRDLFDRYSMGFTAPKYHSLWVYVLKLIIIKRCEKNLSLVAMN